MTLVDASQAHGGLVMDPYLAALASEYGATVVAFDRDFARFDRVEVLRPVWRSHGRSTLRPELLGRSCRPPSAVAWSGGDASERLRQLLLVVLGQVPFKHDEPHQRGRPGLRERDEHGVHSDLDGDLGRVAVRARPHRR